MISMRRFFAFTLTEVLVTLGIIGVISALTIPSLVQGWQKKSYVEQLKKLYVEIQQEFTNLMNQKNAMNLMEAGLSNVDDVRTFLRERFILIEDCGSSSSNINATPCFATLYKNINNESVNFKSSEGYSVFTSKGIAIKMNVNALTFEDINTKALGTLWVDVNGSKAPNILGRDLFEMKIYPDGVIDVEGVPINCRKHSTNCDFGNTPKQTRESYYNSKCFSATDQDYGGCFGKILNDDWEMKY